MMAMVALVKGMMVCDGGRTPRSKHPEIVPEEAAVEQWPERKSFQDRHGFRHVQMIRMLRRCRVQWYSCTRFRVH